MISVFDKRYLSMTYFIFHFISHPNRYFNEARVEGTTSKINKTFHTINIINSRQVITDLINLN